MDPEGSWVRPGMEEQYNAILGEMDVDMASIGRGEEPKWLTGSGKKPPGGEGGEKTVVRSGMFNGKKVVEYSDGTIDYAD